MFRARNIYVYTPGFPKRQGHSQIMNLLILGEFPEYKLIVEEGIIHMVHNKYRQYIVKINYRNGESYDVKLFYKKQEAYEYISICIDRYPSALIEYVMADWTNKIITYGWYKHFIYSRISPISPILQDLHSKNMLEQYIEHPLEQYLFNEFDTISRIDTDIEIEWSINGGIEDKLNTETQL